MKEKEEGEKGERERLRDAAVGYALTLQRHEIFHRASNSNVDCGLRKVAKHVYVRYVLAILCQ